MGQWALNNITAPDTYTPAATLDNLPGPSTINIDVANQAIYWQLRLLVGTGLATEGTWSQEIFMSPGSRSLNRSGVRGVRVRAAIPLATLQAQGAAQAQVTVEAVQ
jgi:hypothetical protein